MLVSTAYRSKKYFSVFLLGVDLTHMGADHHHRPVTGPSGV